jgi:hypothetical protein
MSSILQKQVGVLPGLIALTLNNEILVAYTGRCEAIAPTLRAIVRGWLNLTLGTGVTGITTRIRRGNGITGAVVLVGGATSLPALINTDFTTIAVETLQNVEYADYSLTVQQIGGSGSGNILIGTIEVELING